ncbi:hypothetical protein C2G38_816903 [Gigaspora rosea]|uniref:Uncharacterized protein n=1 Tax=Gigaspora rosea TaxID=44941 RepID=A0A397U094_9GLOM|nr:hypothetical protein C2G38_816903 [Gigaspora rosea]
MKSLHFWTLLYKNKKNNKGEKFTLKLVGSLLDKWGPIPKSVLLKWDDETYQKEYNQLISQTKLKPCMTSLDNEGIPKYAISGRLVHLDANSNFTEVVYRFASPMVSNTLIEKYQTQTGSSVRDFIISSHRHPKAAGFRGNLFEGYAHLELQRGGKFRVRCLNDNSGVNERNIKEMKCNWFMTLNEARKKCYNRPKSKTFASIDSFCLDGETLDLYQMTISKNHGVKVGNNGSGCIDKGT